MQHLAVHKKIFPILLIGFLALFVYAYYPTILDLWVRWNKFDESYSHGMLVLAISAFYLFVQLRAIPSLAVNPCWFGPALLLGSSILWVLAFYAHIEAIQHILLPWVIWLFCYSLLGWHTAKKLLFPVGFLYFAIPIWDVLTEPLQYITTDVNGFLLALVGVEAHIEDVFVTISVGKFEIAGGCSGLRYLIISITLTSLYSYLNYSRAKSAATLIIVGILLALFANWIRVFIIILAGHFTNMESSLINEHDHFGWLVFAITLIPLFFLAHKLESNVEHTSQQPAQEKAAENTQSNANISPAYALLFTLITLSAAIAVPIYASYSKNNNTNSSYSIDIEMGAALDQWQRSYLKANLISPPKFTTPDGEFDAIYSDGTHNIQLSIRSYIQQAQGKELINFNNRLYDQSTFINHDAGSLGIPNNDFNYLIIKGKDKKLELIGYQYLVANMATSNRVMAKLLEIIRPLIGSPTSTLIYTRIRCTADCTAELPIMSEFIHNNYSQITHFKSGSGNH